MAHRMVNALFSFRAEPGKANPGGTALQPKPFPVFSAGFDSCFIFAAGIIFDIAMVVFCRRCSPTGGALGSPGKVAARAQS